MIPLLIQTELVFTPIAESVCVAFTVGFNIIFVPKVLLVKLGAPTPPEANPIVCLVAFERTISPATFKAPSTPVKAMSFKGIVVPLVILTILLLPNVYLHLLCPK